MRIATPTSFVDNVIPSEIVRTLVPTNAAHSAFSESTAKYGGKSALAKAPPDVRSADAPIDLGELVIIGRKPEETAKSNTTKTVLVMAVAAVVAWLVFR